MSELCTNKWALASLHLFHLKTRISHNNQTLFVLIDFRGKKATMFCWCFDNIMGCVEGDIPDNLASLQKYKKKYIQLAHEYQFNWIFRTAFFCQFDENIACTFPNLLMTQSLSNHGPESPRLRSLTAHSDSGPGTLAPAPTEFCSWVSSLQTLGSQCQDHLYNGGTMSGMF